MKTTSFINLKSLSSLMLAFVLILGSCSKSDEVTVSENTLNVNTESSEDSYHNDADDLANSIASLPDGSITGRSEGVNDTRFCTDTKVTLRKADNENSDTLIIDFGTVGCKDVKGNTRKGKIIVIFNPGKRSYPQFTNTVTFENFFVNGVKVEGTRTIKNVTSTIVEGAPDITFDISLTGGKLTFPDGTTATRTTRHFRQWARGGTALDFSDDQQKILAFYIEVQSTASGSNRKGYTYEMKVTKDIVYKNSCLKDSKIFIPVSGTKTLKVTKDGKSVDITVDYGDGTCDKTVTITTSGKTETVTVSRDDNG
jgi:hypothetical protein